MLEGVTPLTDGNGYVTAMDTALEVPPPGAGVNTVTGTCPGFFTSAAVIAACNCVLLT
jgi:hypothetical protein